MGKKSGWAWQLISSYGLADFLEHEDAGECGKALGKAPVLEMAT